MMRRFRALALLLLVTAVPARSDIGPGYQPKDKDERGLWMQVEEQERRLQTSDFVIHDAALNDYVRGVFCRTVGETECRGARIYLIRSPIFNAGVAPNGMILVNSGLFLRIRDEAQLATVLGHEYTHYRRQHSLQLFRQVKGKTDAMAWMAMIPIANIGLGLAVMGAQYGIAGSLFSFSREMEREADMGGLQLLVKAGYDPLAASRVWEQVEAERAATAAARNKRKKSEGGFFATHPTSLERLRDLKAAASGMAGAGSGAVGRDAYRKALGLHWANFIDDQVKLNDFGGTDLLLGQIAAEGWTPELLFARGELYRSRGRPDDLVQAAKYYRDAIAAGDAPIESHRGLGLALIRSGARSEGEAALKEYLLRRPDAGDRSMIAMLAGEQR